MLDFFKIETSKDKSNVYDLIDADVLLEHPKKRKVFTWHNFEADLSRNDGTITLSGSLHKLYNHVFLKKGYANFSDFTFSQLIQAVQLITDTFGLDSDTFGLNPFTMPIRSVEFGVNVIPPLNSKRLILGARTLHNELPETKFQNHFSRFKFDQYNYKLYDKAGQYRGQYKIEGELLRLEIHVDRMLFIKGYDIHYLIDILRPDKVSGLYKPLIQAINNIQFSPGLYSFPELTKPEQKLIDKLLDTVYTAELSESNTGLRRLQYYNRRFDKLLAKYGIQDYREILGELVSQKWNELCQTDAKTSTELTGYLSQFPQFSEPDFLLHSQGKNFNQINRSNMMLKELNLGINASCEIASSRPLNEEQCRNEKKCLSCGRQLAKEQRKSAKYCSEKFVGNKAAHKCRNMASNPIHNKKRGENRTIAKISKLQLAD